MFIGRQNELRYLQQLLNKNTASLVAIKGRRRIGKSRLIEEFSQAFKTVFLFTGLPPDEKITAKNQRVEFMHQMARQKIPCTGKDDWGDMFFDVSQYTEQGRVLVVLDEITWMGSLDPTFLGKLKIAWDSYFKKNPKLILIVSGSNSAWIEKNILSKTGYFGRVSLRITLDQLALHHCAEFWGKYKDNICAYEKLKILAVTGGVPRYLEEVQGSKSAEQNIFELCYQRGGILFNEFDDIFSDLFTKRNQSYKDLIYAIADGKRTVNDIAKALGREKGGDLSAQLEALCLDGFISRDYAWNLKTAMPTTISCYRLSDNYFRFYINYILPYKTRIEADNMSSLPSGWMSIMGLQFENLVINSRKTLYEILQIPLNEVLIANPYLQTKTKEREKCQIDYLIQTQYNTLYLCEIKFSKHEIGSSILAEVEEKIRKLQCPKGFSIRPVLIHVNGVSDSVVASNLFAHIVDFSALL